MASVDLADSERRALEVLPTLPALELASAWRAVHGFFTSKVKTAVELTLPQAKEFKSLQNDVIWAYANPHPPAKLNPELEGAAFVLMAPLPEATPAIAAQVASWVARGGLPFALESIARGFGRFTNANHGERYQRSGSLLVTSEQRPWLPLEVRIDALFRAELARASGADRTAARETAAALRKEPFPGARSLLSAIFLDSAWLDADLEERVRTGKPMVFTPLSLFRATDGGRVAAFFEAMTAREFDDFAPDKTRPSFANALQARFPDAQPIAAWFERAVTQLRDADTYARFSSTATLAQLSAMARTLAGNERIAKAMVMALTALQNERFSKATDPRPAFIDLLRAEPKVSAPLVKRAAEKKMKWAVALADQLERAAAAGGAPPPRAGTFWLPASFSPLLTIEGPLPQTEVEALQRVFRRRDPAELKALAARCTRGSLTSFTWDLFQAWVGAGAPSTGRWAILALGDFGDDDTARKLAALIRQWPGESAHQRAITGLEVLADIGTDTALRMLDSIARRVRYRALQDRARDLMTEIAQRRKLTATELSDRLMPDAGLGADGSRVVSFGARSFRVSVDARLSPVVTNEQGKRLANLPSPNASDDATLAARSVEAWQELKKVLKDDGPDIALGFELAMADERRWPTAAFEEFVLRQPLLLQLVRSLLWGTFTPEGKLRQAFVISPMQRPVTLAGEPLSLPADAAIGLVHPLLLTEEQAAVVSDAFSADGSGPFEQLTRKVFTLGPKEWDLNALHRYEGRTASSSKLRRLRERGWRLGPPLDAGVIHWLSRRIGPDTVAALNIDGLMVGGEKSERVGLSTIVFGDGYEGDEDFVPDDASERSVDTRSRVAISELLRDVDAIVDPEEK
jgi:hypothetical protein